MSDAVSGWTVLGLAGFLFFVVGTADLLLLWYPAFFGDAVWEFGTITGMFNGLPAPTIGLAMLAASALARGKAGSARLLAVVLGLIALIVIVVAVLYLTDVPVALRGSGSDPLVLVGIKKAIAKTAVQALLYPVMLISMAVVVWRRAVRASQD
jgi:hypothetical protein